jgi:3-dehydroquinate dehydratase
MSARGFDPGARVVRTGADLPHLGVHVGRVYVIEVFDPDSDNGLVVKGVVEGLDPIGFRLAQDDQGA